MKIICSVCGRDLNEIWQDNMSSNSNRVLCEDCYYLGDQQKELEVMS